MPRIINHLFILQREEGSKGQGQGLNIGKGNSSEVDETKGFMTLGHFKLDPVHPV